MKIGIVANQYKDKRFEFTHQITKYLNGYDIVPFIAFDLLYDDCKYILLPENELYSKVDTVIVVGGDGTLLGASYPCAKNNVPILGVNMGTLGYLSNVEKDEIFPAIDKLLKGETTIDERIMIEASFDDDEIGTKVALNDLVVTKGLHSKIVSLQVSINDVSIGLIRGDGIIVSTPTGSTAYNLSAMGPILEPSSDIIVLTPIAPQTYSRPIVISANEEIKIKVSYRSIGDIALSCDGQIVKYIQNDEEITIRKSKLSTKLLKAYDKSFYDIFKNKFFHVY